MKNIFLMLTLALLLTSCFWWEEDKQLEKQLDNKEENKSFENPSNIMESEINARELYLDSKNKDELLDLAKSYLKYWNAYFNEERFAVKALEILNGMKSELTVEYLKWYAYEIQTKYSKALKQYDMVLAIKNITKEQKIEALNQKWHVLDLQWYLKKANNLYLEAEQLDLDNLKTMINRWRYEIRIWENEKAKIYFDKILNKTEDKYLKSEMYYDLSIIFQQKDDLNNAIKNAKLGIIENKDYPNNYLSLWALYILQDWDLFDKAPEQLKKAIELYSNSSTAYKNLGIYYYIKDDFDNAIKNFKKQVEVSTEDILLMWNDKKRTQIAWEYDLAKSYALKSDVKSSIKYLKKVLNWDNLSYYYWFIREYSNIKWPFRKINDNSEFINEVKNILVKYKK